MTRTPTRPASPVPLGLLAALLLGSTGCAGTAPLPDADEVITRMVEAEGGDGGFRTRYLSAEIHLVGMGLLGAFEQWNAGDGKLLETIEFPDIGIWGRGISGDVVWTHDLASGVRILEGAERAETVRAARLGTMPYLDHDYPRRRTTGVESIDGREMWVLALTTSDGAIEEWCVDRETGLRRLVRTRSETERGSTTTLYHELDYRRVDGVLIPFLARLEMGPETTEIRTLSVEHDVEIPDEVFELPESVREYLEAMAD